MTVEESTHIIISKSNKEKLDDFKLNKRESYNSVMDELIELGEKNNFKNIRIENLTKNIEGDVIENKQKTTGANSC
ncbi:MAG: hypothetical protein ACFFDF_03960 [Candidatus Odinarchaeota archaeon]